MCADKHVGGSAFVGWKTTIVSFLSNLSCCVLETGTFISLEIRKKPGWILSFQD